LILSSYAMHISKEKLANKHIYDLTLNMKKVYREIIRLRHRRKELTELAVIDIKVNLTIITKNRYTS